MSNITSIAGASIWMLVSTILIFAALEPVSVTGEAAPAHVSVAAHAAAAAPARA